MIVEKLSIWLNKRLIWLKKISGIILLIAIYLFMTYLSTVSYPVSFIESQFSFSGELIK